MKKLLVLLALTLLALSLFAFAEEPETFSSGDFDYVLLPDGTAKITTYNGKAESLNIPSALDGYTVTSIGDRAFSFSITLTKVTIPDSVTAIEANPFLRCENLKTISVSAEHPYLSTIDGVLFSKPDKRLICYPCAFDASEYAIPQGIQIIGDYAFSECGSLTDATIPDSVTSIGNLAFEGCSNLTAVTIPDSVTSIGDLAFSGCESLTAVTVPDSVTSIGYGAFICCYSLTAVTIPDSVTSIGDWAFAACASMTAVTIPDSVTSIGEDVFSDCAESLMITVGRDSYAAQYCRENGLQYAYPDALDWLKG